ncbi:hypothetical protein P9281_27365 [Caballeronia sp. LP003]|uniref:hypothetical protein n=1 Tax=Caballeronia sp. LP003 TaxID=3038551 RepID=UPI002858D167|nr:hypothetical protein [Caballeronia sp. LP003]MDR5790269.1 hypothetical protein [Caballeronia sp. LP003]
MTPHVKRMLLRGIFEALCVLIVMGVGVVFIVSLLGGCTLVFVRSSGDVALEQVGGHNGWSVVPATRDTPSLRERIFGVPASETRP